MKKIRPHLLDQQRWKNLRIGLLGGSFNPPHPGHLHIAQLALRRLDLDYIWWLVTPQNPLKSEKVSYKERFDQVENILAPYPKMIATDLEQKIDAKYTYQTIENIKTYFPQSEFIWICGMDNALIFHRWDRWRYILKMMPVVFIARPPAYTLIRRCPLRQYYSYKKHVLLDTARRINLKKPKIYWMLSAKMMDISSTKIRNKNKSLAEFLPLSKGKKGK